MNFCSQKEQPAAVKCRVAENEPGNLFFISVRRNIGKRKLTAVCSHQTRIGNLDAHLI